MNNKSMIINFIDSKHPVPLLARRPEHVAHGRRDAQAEGAASVENRLDECTLALLLLSRELMPGSEHI